MIADDKGVIVPSQHKPATGDTQEGPSVGTMDNAVVHSSNVTSESSTHHCVDIYTMEEENLETRTLPFIHPVELKGEKGIPSRI